MWTYFKNSVEIDYEDKFFYKCQIVSTNLKVFFFRDGLRGTERVKRKELGQSQRNITVILQIFGALKFQ